MDNIAELFEQEVAEKKKIALSANKKGHSPKSQKGWYNFGMPKGYLNRKEQEQLGGEVRVYNMKDQLEGVKSYKEVMEMSKEEGKEYIDSLRKKYSVRKLTKHWGISSYILYNKLFKKFDIEKLRDAIESMKPAEKEVKTVVCFEKKADISFAVEMNGEMTVQELSTKMKAIADMLSTSDSKYQVSFRVAEVKDN